MNGPLDLATVFHDIDLLSNSILYCRTAGASVGYQPQSYEFSNAAEGQEIVRIPREIGTNTRIGNPEYHEILRHRLAIFRVEFHVLPVLKSCEVGLLTR